MSAKAGGRGKRREEKRGQDGSSEELWLEVSGAQFDAGKMQWSCGVWREEYLFGGQAEGGADVFTQASVAGYICIP